MGGGSFGGPEVDRTFGFCSRIPVSAGAAGPGSSRRTAVAAGSDRRSGHQSTSVRKPSRAWGGIRRSITEIKAICRLGRDRISASSSVLRRLPLTSRVLRLTRLRCLQLPFTLYRLLLTLRVRPEIFPFGLLPVVVCTVAFAVFPFLFFLFCGTWVAFRLDAFLSLFVLILAGGVPFKNATLSISHRRWLQLCLLSARILGTSFSVDFFCFFFFVRVLALRFACVGE